ncbi:putative UPF0496 protein 2 isoform X2 [Dioscorea cayenensis subsp. rotundata]|uniref:UPF0496 protein 2 isoform X2 n=1 Tax=Dioscorea cayennensis subsp. rotundata TaxID=55577 RepID=A0AB40C8I0_DIOCR|nr:putative UPF0496 protein 2 isoform X2 [Dioscorea cayenensis subsp. rotundata]
MVQRWLELMEGMNVEEEYKQTLRTKSYIEIWNKGHHKFHKSITNNSSPFSIPDLVLEPKQEVLISTTKLFQGFSDRDPLVEYFDATFQAFNACSSLLASIESTRGYYHAIRNLLNKTNKFSELTSMLDLPNPVSPQTLTYFQEMSTNFGSLTQRLIEARRRMKRRIRVVNDWKRVTVVVLVVACSAAAVAAMVVAGHVLVVFGVVVAAPVVVAGKRGKKIRRVEKNVDEAARGAYIMGRDMETMSRMVRRVGDEVEHRREVAKMAVRSGERRMVMEAVKEMESGEEGFERQVEELEEHVYLSLLTINRSRNLVANDIFFHDVDVVS